MRRAIAGLFLVWAAGCSSNRYAMGRQAEPGDGAMIATYAPAPEPVAPSEEAPPPPPQNQPSAPKPTPRRERLVQYSGFAKLRVTSPNETIAAAVKLAEDVKGYVETRSGTSVTLRVPVATVRDVFARVLGMGEVLAKSLTAQDVTDAFLATELRLKTLRTSRDRLTELLALAQNEQQKLSLLREIQRLTEQVVQLEVQLKTMQQLAVYSRIVVDTEARQALTSRPVDDHGAFQWIHDLAPASRSVALAGETLELEAPDGMVVLDDDHWIAESADGATLATSKRHNEPHGDTAFWLAALKARLTKEYPQVEDIALGRYTLLRMTDTSDGYRYLVGVLVDDDDLQVIEIYYPTAEHERRYGPAILATLERGAS